jgi:hypothetical protein
VRTISAPINGFVAKNSTSRAPKWLSKNCRLSCNAPAQPRRAHVPDEITPRLTPADGCSGLGCRSDRLAHADIARN